MPTIPLSVAPMLDKTDRHCRYFLRLISRHIQLYTEMITTHALLHGDPQRFLAYDPAEQPVACQLGGSDPADLAKCAQIVATVGYTEINLNVGCPSDRVSAGRFGACLMAEPLLVADCVAAMRAVTTVPVTVKTRIGIDDHDAYEALVHFIDTVAAAGCQRFIIHARKAWLHGLSPKENRTIPPLRYDVVYALARDFPHLSFVLNGGLTDLDHVATVLQQVDGAMIGRAAYDNPYLLATVDQRFFGRNTAPPNRKDIVRAFLPYVDAQCQHGTPLSCMTRHILGLFQAQPGARAFRRRLSEGARRNNADAAFLAAVLAEVPD